MKAWIIIAIIAAAGLSHLLTVQFMPIKTDYDIFIIDDAARYAKHTSLPPGYGLKTNQKGRYRPYRLSSGQDIELYFGQTGTRQDAIDRAWGQFYHENTAIDNDKWRIVE